MQFITLSEDTEAGYRAFLDALPGRSASCSLEFRRLCKSYLGATDHYLLAMDDAKQVIGALPCFSIDGKFGTVINSLPFRGTSGGLIVDPVHPQRVAIRAALLSEYARLCTELNAAAHTIWTSPFEADTQAYQAALEWDFRKEFAGQVSVLSAAGVASQTSVSVNDALMQSFHPKVRSAIRKSEKSGMRIAEEWSEELLFAVAALHREHGAASDVPGGERFFTALAAAYTPGQTIRIFAARMGDDLAAALLLLYSGATVEYFCPVVDPRWRSLQPLGGLIRTAMLQAISEKRRYWNWGSVADVPPATVRMRNQLGGKEYPHFRLTKLCNPDLRTATPSELEREYPHFFVAPPHVLLADPDSESAESAPIVSDEAESF